MSVPTFRRRQTAVTTGIVAIAVAAILALGPGCAGGAGQAEPAEAEQEGGEMTAQSDDSGETATPSVGDIEARTWRLASYAGEAVPEGIEITLRLEAGTVTGSGGCNRYTGGSYGAGDDGTLLELSGPFAATRRACPPPRGEWESRYLSALDGATGFALRMDDLVLTTADGSEMVFRAAPQEPAG